MAKHNENGQEQAPYVPPDFDETREFGALPEEGWHDSSLARMWDSDSKSSGNPMLTGIFVIDNGDAVGQQVREFYPLGHPKKIGEGKLKSLGVKAGFKWKGGIPLDEFAAQFVDFEEPLRVGILVKHQYSVKLTSGGWKNDVTQEEYNAWSGDRGIKPQIRGYGVARNDPELEVEAAYGDPSTEFQPGKGDLADDAETEDWMDDEEEGEYTFEPDDDLPF